MRSAPTTPVAADSDGVATPSRISPMTEKMITANGSTRMTAITFSPALTDTVDVATSSAASFGSRRTRPRV